MKQMMVWNGFVVISIFAIFNFAEAQIVQPNKYRPKLFDVPSKVSVNTINLKETERIRDEIKSAVKADKFFVQSQHHVDEGVDKIYGNGTIYKGNATHDPILMNNATYPKVNTSNDGKIETQEEPLAFLSESRNIMQSSPNTNATTTKGSAIASEIKNKSAPENGLIAANATSATAQEEKKVPESDPNLEKGGLIVQPEWTNNKSNKKSSGVVKVTEKNLQEAARIREQIKSAVADHSQAINSPGSDRVMKEVDEYFQHRYRLRSFLTDLVGTGGGDDGRDEENIINDHYEKPPADAKQPSRNGPIVPNVVDSIATREDTGDDASISDLNLSTLESRPTSSEVLNLTSIEEFLDFNFTEPITSWKVIEYLGRTLAAGIMHRSLTILSRLDEKLDLLKTAEFSEIIVDFDLFLYWNKTSGMAEEMVVIAFKESIAVMSATSHEQIAKWIVGGDITGLKYYRTPPNDHHLAILTSPPSGLGMPRINIYEFNPDTNSFWMNQAIPLEHPCSEVVFMDTGRDIVLAVPQKTATVIFTYNPEVHEHARFQSVTRVESAGVQSISGFQMGGFSYLAISGHHPQILRYHRGQFFPQTIFGQSFQFVERFLPVPARTYRDDLILLVQHKISYDTHTLPVVEALIWDGKSFQSSSDAPCLIGNENVGFGASCLIDPERDDGIKGAAVISASGDISLLVPRMAGPSGYFTVSMGLFERDLEGELERIFENLKEAAEEQISVVQQAEEYGSFLEDTLVVDYLRTSEITFDGVIEEIYINDHLVGEDDDQMDINALLDLLNDTKKEIRRLEELSETPIELTHTSRSRRDVTDEALTVDQIEVEELFVENVNGVPVEEVLFIKSGVLSFPGTVEVQGNLEVEDKGSSSLPNILEVERTSIEGNLDFDHINGIAWCDFIGGVVLSNVVDEVENLTVDGTVFIEDGLSIRSVNELNFPNDFLLSSGPEKSTIVADKTFYGTFAASALEVEQSINSIDLKDVITLSDDQIIPGTTVFNDLEVTEILEITGRISGEGFETFVPNTNLLESSLITANCEFNHLEVNGPIIISGLLNNKHFEHLLNDIVYDTNENVTISSQKTFSTAKFTKNVEIEDRAMSGIPINAFVTKDTEQELQISKISGDVFFNFLKLEGLFDSVNITELDANSVKIFESQDTDIELIFEGESNIHANSLDILEYVNDNPVDSYRTIFGDLELDNAQIDSFSAVTLTSNSPLQGIGGIINQINMNDFLESRMSLTKTQNISGNFEVTELVVESDAFVESLNGLSTTFVLWFMQTLNNLPKMIQAGEMTVKHLHVTGGITATTLNGVKFNEEIQDRVIWLNRPNFIRTPLRFLDPVVVDGPLLVEGHLNDQLLQDILDDLVLKTDDEIILTGRKKFLDTVNVLESTTVSQINGVPISKIATKSLPIEFDGSVKITGILFAKNLEVKQNINEHEIDDILDFVRFDEELNSLVFLKMTVFRGYPMVEDLYVEGSLNWLHNLDAFFQELVYKDKPAAITGRKLFANSVNFQNGTHIGCLNGLNVSDLLENVVPSNGILTAVIESPVTFLKPVVGNSVTVQAMLYTTNLMGCDIHNWFDNSIRTDLPADVTGTIHFGPGTLNWNSLNVLKLNGLNMDDIITLHTPQNLSGNYKFSRVFLDGSLETAGYVNGVDLTWERQNTFMVDGDQHIMAPTAIRSATVLRDLEIIPHVNNKDLNNLATLNTAYLHLQSPMAFSNVITKQVYTEDLISGINVSTWYHDSLWNTNRDKQIVVGKWRCDHVTITEVMEGNSILNGVPISQITSQLGETYQEALRYFEQIEDYQRQICYKTLDLVKRTQKQIYFLKHFEDSFRVLENGPINRLIFFKDGRNTYLLVNVYCYSTIYLWNGHYFKKISGMDSGLIHEVLAIPNSAQMSTYIVTNSEQNTSDCNISGINIWSLGSESHELEYRGNYGYPGYYAMIHHSPDYAGRFYGIDEKSNLVIEVDIESDRNKTWNLPPDHTLDYRFLPHSSDLGIALSDGQRLLVIERKKAGRSRKRRFLGETENWYSAPNSGKSSAEVSIFVNRKSQSHSNKENRVISDLVNVLDDLVYDLGEEVSSVRNITIYGEELRNLFNNYSAISAKRRANTSSLLEVVISTNNSTVPMIVSDKNALGVAKRLHDALNRLNEIQNSLRSETVGSPLSENNGVLNFEDIVRLIRNGFTDMINIFLIRRETFLGKVNGSQSNQSEEINNKLNHLMEDLRSNVEILKGVFAKTKNTTNYTKPIQEQPKMQINNEAAKSFAKLTNEEMKTEMRSSNTTLDNHSSKENGVIMDLVHVLDDLVNYVGEVSSVRNITISGEELRNLFNNYSAISAERRANTSSLLDIVKTTNNFTVPMIVSDKNVLGVAKKFHDTLSHLTSIQNSFASEVVGSPVTENSGVLNFEDIVRLIRNGFTDMVNIFLIRRETLLGEVHGSENKKIVNESEGININLNHVMEDLRTNVEILKGMLAKTKITINDTRPIQEQHNMNITNEAAKPFAKSTNEEIKFEIRSSNTTSETNNFDLADGAQKAAEMRNSSSNLVNEVKAFLLKLIENLSEEAVSEDNSEKEPDEQDIKFVIEKFKEALEEMAKRNSSFKKHFNESTAIGPSHFKTHMADINITKKLLRAWDQTKQSTVQKFPPNRTTEEVGIVHEGDFGSVGFEGILTILSNGFTNLHNYFLRRRDDMLGSSPKSSLNQQWSAASIVEDIKGQLQNLYDKLKVAEESFKHREKLKGLNKFDNGIHDGYFTPATPSPHDQNSWTIEPPKNNENLSTESVIAYEIPAQDLLIAYNDHLPGRSSGEEIIAFKVGSLQNRRTIIAVSHSTKHQIPGQHDAVKLYFDIEQGNLFQTLSTFRPRSLTALHLGDETVLAFVEDKYLIRMLVYRGVQGFVELAAIKLEHPVAILTSASFPKEGNCPGHFLVAVVDNEIIFYEAKMAGRCGIHVNFSCDRY